jgi:hypothetical protein
MDDVGLDGASKMTGCGSRRNASVWLCAAAILLLAQAAPGQERQQQPAQATTQTQPEAPPPTLLHALTRWFDESLANVGLHDVQSPLGDLGARSGEAVKDAAEVAVGAAGAVVRLPTTRVVTARQRCELAGNGAPDCQTAANTVCRTMGFWSGRSVDIESAQKCPAQVWLSRRSPEPGECALETYVTRAICQ